MSLQVLYSADQKSNAYTTVYVVLSQCENTVVITTCSVLPMGQKILTLSRILTKCFKWSENGQKIRTKSENAAEDSEEETNTIMLILCNTAIDIYSNQ